jgi:hypothetical protein
MTSLRTRILGSAAALTIAALPACGGDDGATFAKASPEQLQRAFQAGSGADAGSVLLIGLFLSGADDPTACPRLATQGAVTTVTGGCTDAEGVRFDGSIRIDNLPGFFEENPAFDPSRPSRVTADDFRVRDGDQTTSIDGSVELDWSTSVATIDLTIGFGGITTTSQLVLREDRLADTSTADAGSSISVSGLGSAEVSGTWSLGGDFPEGAMTLRGADTIVFDIGGTTADGCIPYRISSGATGQLCDEVSERRAELAPSAWWQVRPGDVRGLGLW